MKTTTLALALFATLALPACHRAATPAAETHTAPKVVPLSVKPWTLPVETPAGQPDLSTAPDGRLLLSWVEPTASGHALKLSRFVKGTWETPMAVAAGDDWFVNWADTPHVAITPDGALWAHWLRKSGVAKYAYDVALVRSGDAGRTWSAPVLVNNDGKQTEHGFVSLWAAGYDTLGIAWLDGREAAQAAESDAGAHGGHGGAMTLRTARFDAQLQRQSEMRVDAMTCDCCQTDVAQTTRGTLLVYRDRTPEEIRDIAVARQQGDSWTTPRLVHADNWKMPACPVNGPAVAARAQDVVVAWYTAAGDVPALKIARSRDSGDRFEAPVTLDKGEAVQGRVDVALDGTSAWALWLREDANGQSLQLARFEADLSREKQRVEVARLQGRGRATGFPQLEVQDGKAFVVWTDVVEGKPALRAAVVGG